MGPIAVHCDVIRTPFRWEACVPSYIASTVAHINQDPALALPLAARRVSAVFTARC